MYADFLLNVFREAPEKEAIIFLGRPCSYGWLLERIEHWLAFLERQNITPGTVTILQADFSPNTVALLVALIQRWTIIVPITPAAAEKAEEFIRIAQGEVIIHVDEQDNVNVTRTGVIADHELYQKLRETDHPGLVLFSSGSTGASKGAVHDLARLLAKFHTRRHDLRTVAFLLFDHIGGLDTLFYCLSNRSTLVFLRDRSPDAVCKAVQDHKVEVLPVAPTFLNLLSLSGVWRNYDLRSLKYVTYGAEVMPEATLKRCVEMFPSATILQKYGTTEVGTMRSKSRSSDSLWVKLGGEGYQWRVREGLLEIKAESAMLGYLNAPSPFTEDGWFMTGDCVEVDGEWLRILGRKSDIINVGGQKVYPAEVENVLRQIPNVADATVYGERNPLLGSIVVAKIQTVADEELNSLRQRVKTYCAQHMEAYKVPVKILLSGDQSNARFKKIRREQKLD